MIPESKYNKLKDVVNQAKNALLAQWEESGAFVDKNKLRTPGALPEGIGLTSALLFLVAFHSERDIIGGEDRTRFNSVVNASFRQLYGWTENGFVATPLITRDGGKLFNADFGYTDTVVWCLSSSILARYAQQSGALDLDADTKEMVFDLMARSLQALLNAQKDGCWGFRTDKDATKTLYYTSMASASLADFFDYILYEIKEVVENNEEDTAVSSVDTEVLQYLDNRLGINTRKAVEEARAALQDWLVKDCLPLLPRLATCDAMRTEDLARLGASSHDPLDISDEDEEGNTNKYYHNLYYTYYLIDMMVMHSVDEAYRKIAADKEKLVALSNYYAENKLISEVNHSFFFDLDDQNDNYKKFFSMCVEQAVHYAQAQYMAASKTGYRFWDIMDSELPIAWKHDDKSVTMKVITPALSVERISGAAISDPTIIPMALRSNISYSYYVSDRPDITIERLFDDICNQACSTTPTPDQEINCVPSLWDQQNYSLPVTERVIESLIDFYDYYCKFESEEGTVASKTSAPKSAKSDLELALEKMVASYLQSEEGKRLLLDTVGASAAPAAPVAAPAPVQKTPAATDSTSMMKTVDKICEYLENFNVLDDEEPDDRLVRKIVRLAETLRVCGIKVRIAQIKGKGSKANAAAREKEINDAISEYNKSYDALMTAILNDLEEPSLALPTLYDILKRQN